MKLFAISDLHMPGGDDKPMNVFGSQWDNHVERIFADWRSRVGEEDVVLLPGDLTWAMQLKDAAPDIAAIGQMPGRKLIMKGNHEYWWNTLSQVKSIMPKGMEAIQVNAIDVGCAVVCGTRGWNFPTKETALTPENQKIYNREVLRLEMSLKEAQRLRGEKPLVAMMHFPPLYPMERDTAFTALMEQYQVDVVVYGHLHGDSVRIGFTGEHHGVQYHLVSCDSLDFCLKEIPLGAES